MSRRMSRDKARRYMKIQEDIRKKMEKSMIDIGIEIVVVERNDGEAGAVKIYLKEDAKPVFEADDDDLAPMPRDDAAELVLNALLACGIAATKTKVVE